MAFIPLKTIRRMEAACNYLTHSFHAEGILDTAKTGQRDNNIIERLEKNLADSLELDKTLLSKLPRRFNSKRSFSTLSAFIVFLICPLRLASPETVFVERLKLPMPSINISHLFSKKRRALFYCHLLPQKKK